MKVGDFGLAINTAREKPQSRVGTLDYMPPEVRGWVGVRVGGGSEWVGWVGGWMDGWMGGWVGWLGKSGLLPPTPFHTHPPPAPAPPRARECRSCACRMAALGRPLPLPPSPPSPAPRTGCPQTCGAWASWRMSCWWGGRLLRLAPSERCVGGMGGCAGGGACHARVWRGRGSGGDGGWQPGGRSGGCRTPLARLTQMHRPMHRPMHACREATYTRILKTAPFLPSHLSGNSPVGDAGGGGRVGVQRAAAAGLARGSHPHTLPPAAPANTSPPHPPTPPHIHTTHAPCRARARLYCAGATQGPSCAPHGAAADAPPLAARVPGGRVGAGASA